MRTWVWGGCLIAVVGGVYLMFGGNGTQRTAAPVAAAPAVEPPAPTCPASETTALCQPVVNVVDVRQALEMPAPAVPTVVTVSFDEPVVPASFVEPAPMPREEVEVAPVPRTPVEVAPMPRPTSAFGYFNGWFHGR